MKYELFFDATRTKTVTVLLWDEASKHCAVIDSVLDYDQFSGRTYTDSIEKLTSFIKQNGLKLEWILETHIHADHLTASHHLKQTLGGKIAIGKNITTVLEYWKNVFEDEEIKTSGEDFDKLFEDGEEFKVGSLPIKVIHTPGHTPACIAYYVAGHLFVGDTIFSPTVGTARTDFPGGSAAELYRSIQKIFNLPEETKIIVGHDYPNDITKPNMVTTVEEEKKSNVLINKNTSFEEFVKKREEKQKNSAVPMLILPSLHVNLRAGRLPKFIKIPVNKI